MKNKELEKLIQKSYMIPESDKSKYFIISHNKRSCNLFEIVINELKYMGLKSFLAGILLCSIFLFISKTDDENLVWAMVSLIPSTSLIPLFFISKSQRYGMSEFEDASRFSTRFIRMVRMGILGLFSLVIILVGSFIININMKCGIMKTLMYILMPYLFSIWMGMIITRKIHGEESIYGVFATGFFSAFLPTLIKELQNLNTIPSFVYIALLLFVLLLNLNECTMYINERTYFEWN